MHGMHYRCSQGMSSYIKMNNKHKDYMNKLEMFFWPRKGTEKFPHNQMTVNDGAVIRREECMWDWGCKAASMACSDV